MIYFKFFGGSLIVISSFFIGEIISKGYIKRTNALRNSRLVVNEIMTTLDYTLNTPEELIRSVAETKGFDCDYLNIAVEGIDRGIEFKKAWYEAIENSKEGFITSDIKVLKQIGRILGASDLQTQHIQLELLINELDLLINTSTASQLEKIKLVKSTAILSGFAVTILLI